MVSVKHWIILGSVVQMAAPEGSSENIMASHPPELLMELL
jgi:hypothetical protein